MSTHSNDLYVCRHLILATPPSTIDRVAFQPSLGPELAAAHSSHSSGAAIKFVAVYERPMWREGDAPFSRSIMCLGGNKVTMKKSFRSEEKWLKKVCCRCQIRAKKIP